MTARSKASSCLFLLLVSAVVVCTNGHAQPSTEIDTETELHAIDYLQQIEIEKHALVVYAENYEHLPKVTNAYNDAAIIQQALQRLGFNVETIPDPTKDQLVNRVKEFSGRALAVQQPTKTIVAFYFAGHGFHAGSGNFVVPIDSDPADLVKESVAISWLEEKLATDAVALSVILLDACRTELIGGNVSENGLQWYSQPQHTGQRPIFYGFSSAFGQPSQSFVNQSDSNSPFAHVLAQNIGAHGKTLTEVFERVRTEVVNITNGIQRPQPLKIFLGEHYLLPDDEYMNDLREKLALAIFGGSACVHKYISQFPAGPFTTKARQWMIDWNQTDVTTSNCPFPVSG